MQNEGEASREALKIRAEGHRKIAQGHRLLGKAIEPGNLPSNQSADNHFEGHKLIAQGHELLARADEMLLPVVPIDPHDGHGVHCNLRGGGNCNCMLSGPPSTRVTTRTGP